jgi:DNA-directed RNA polymerase specialized sigma24 family protein
MRPSLGQQPRAERVFVRLHRRHVGDVYRYALAMLQDEAVAEAVTRTTFANARRALQHGERPRRPLAWLLALAHGICWRRLPPAATDAAEDDLADRLLTDEAALTGEDVRRALGRLPFDQRAALVLREVEGHTYVEIADVLELPTEAAEALVVHARRGFRDALEHALTCGAAQLAVSRHVDGRLPRAARPELRRHLGACQACAAFARSQGVRREALRELAALPLPASLGSARRIF